MAAIIGVVKRELTHLIKSRALIWRLRTGIQSSDELEWIFHDRSPYTNMDLL